MVSDQEIAGCVESLLRGALEAGETTASLAAVLQRAQAQLGVDLSHKAPYIRDQMDLFFGPRLQPPPTPKPHHQPTPPPPPPAASSPSPSTLLQSQPPLPQLQQQQPQLQLPLDFQQQQQQFAAVMQPQYIYQTMPPPQQLTPVLSPAVSATNVSAVSPQPPVPAMAFYPPPPLAFRYTNALAGVAAGGTVSFQQPPGPGAGVAVGGMASPTAAPAPAGADNSKETGAKRKRGGPGGLNKVCAISPELQAVVGDTAMSRTQIVKQLWAYIRQNNLQDPDDKRKIICNDELRIVFETDATDMFKMNKLLAKHITPLDPTKEAKKFKAPSPAPQQMPPVNQPYVVVSDALAKFIGVQGTVPHDDALKYLWDYIKANQLEDAPNASILCDSQLQELFGLESIPASDLSELLSHHFIQRT
ncbi:tyrosine-protein phosphatase non-receptor type 23-like [Lolium rigidum]|uniref:tyrosine-protein phosphatase non-receptor type 23-like n=1 Tax=Lolium rigidum TaxID=89674 RepID=UPI001F5CE859|nr:tyrosine-protein phosphatase non-receptor type 23-like [Lolium rigidum]